MSSSGDRLDQRLPLSCSGWRGVDPEWILETKARTWLSLRTQHTKILELLLAGALELWSWPMSRYIHNNLVATYNHVAIRLPCYSKPLKSRGIPSMVSLIPVQCQ